MGSRIKRYHVERGAVETEDLVESAIKLELPIPLVVDKQSVTSAILTTLDGWARWILSDFLSDYIDAIHVELEYATAGAGDIDLYDITNSAKIADLVAPTGAVTHTITRVDVTSQMKAKTSAITVGIQAKGDGTNAVTVYSAKLVLVMSFS
jgi:hypothetical protein